MNPTVMQEPLCDGAREGLVKSLQECRVFVENLVTKEIRAYVRLDRNANLLQRR
jgi:hypothetical protein